MAFELVTNDEAKEVVLRTPETTYFPIGVERMAVLMEEAGLHAGAPHRRLPLPARPRWHAVGFRPCSILQIQPRNRTDHAAASRRAAATGRGSRSAPHRRLGARATVRRGRLTLNLYGL